MKRKGKKLAKGGEPRKPKTFDQFKKIFSHQESLEHKRSGENRGVHKANSPHRPGVSEMGSEVRRPRKHYPANNVYGERTEPDIDDPKDHARYALEQQRKVKGPTSGKSGFAKGGYATKSSRFHETQKGVNRQEYHYGDKEQMGTSEAGFQGKLKRIASTDRFRKDSAKNEKDAHKKTLSELRAMSGPTSGKAGFAKGGGVHRQGGLEPRGQSVAGSYARLHKEAKDRPASLYGPALRGEREKSEDESLWKGKAKKQHETVLSELKSMKGPHGKYAEGGSVCMACGGDVADFDTDDFENKGFHGDEANYTGANSGDELGDAGEEKRRKSALLSYLRRKSA